MSVTYNASAEQFRLRAKDTDYIIKIAPEGYLAHVYFGRAVPDEYLSYLLRLDEPPFTPLTNNRDRGTFMDTLPFEYPCFGTGDYREPALKISAPDGTSACDMRYVSHRIYRGKPELEGLPATFATEESGCETLEIVLEDKAASLEATLIYTAFDSLDVITRSVILRNIGDRPCTLTRVYSACAELDCGDLDMITLYGSWARERMTERCRLHHGVQSVGSMKGASSHQYNPFAALCSRETDEDRGEVYGFNLIYSGNFIISAELDQHDKTRLVMGINDLDFSWKLEAGESFTAPEAVMVYSDEGIGKMSRTFHDLYRSNLIRGEYRDKRRPVLINSWEAAYFDFDERKLLKIAEEASKLGIELFVLDDGWFGHRNSDNSSLGDWVVNESKLKGGLKALADGINAMGMKFGLWIEPEMISPDSDLFRAHPDWAIQISGRDLTMSREQYVLDLSRSEIRDCVYGMIKNILDSANIEYIKWDMNRQITEAGSAALPADRQKELWHRYVLGVYDLMERITAEYPHILMENCSGGGGRFDPGMLYYSPQIWCSDDTDAVERLKIQYGTSLCYPCSAMGAHVSDCPNHTVGRLTPFETRGHAAMAGTFGYELDVTRISPEDRAAIPQQIAEFMKYNELIRRGDLYRIGNMFEDNTWDALMFVAKDKSEAMLEYFQVLAKPNRRSVRIKLKGLDPEGFYYEEGSPDTVLSGAALMNCGINVGGLWGDFCSRIYHFLRINQI